MGSNVKYEVDKHGQNTNLPIEKRRPCREGTEFHHIIHNKIYKTHNGLSGGAFFKDPTTGKRHLDLNGKRQRAYQESLMVKAKGGSFGSGRARFASLLKGIHLNL